MTVVWAVLMAVALATIAATGFEWNAGGIWAMVVLSYYFGRKSNERL